jgi:membrane-bound serine protease (ClpP class)
LGAALIVLALVLFVLEAIFTSYGKLGIGGAVAMVQGAMMLDEGPPELRITLPTALGVCLTFAAISVFLMTLVVRAHSNKVQTGESGLIGEIGITRTPLNPSGKVFVPGEYCDATSPVPLSEHAQVRVTAVQGLHRRVEPVPQPPEEVR